MLDHEAYYFRKCYYGFNLQAICDWNRRFIYAYLGHTASVHDSTAFKASSLYQNRSRYFEDEEFVLADKAYALEKHVITPYKGLSSLQVHNKRFNYHLSIPRVKIEHSFGILKARWVSLSNLPLRIDEDRIKGHNRVIEWTMACLVLHNLLLDFQDDDSWLEWSIQNAEDEDTAISSTNDRNAKDEKRAGERRREDLKDRLQYINPLVVVILYF